MRLKHKMSAIASVVAVTALSVQALSPAVAADPVPASATPAAPAADETPAEPEAEGLVDVTVQEKKTSIPLPVGSFELPLGIAGFNLDGKEQILVPDFATVKYGGEAVALSFDVHIAGLLKLTSRKLGATPMGKSSHGGGGYPRKILSTNMPGFFFGPPEMKAYAGSSYTSISPTANGGLARAEAGTKIAELVLPLLVADGIEAKAHVRQLSNGEWETATSVRFARLDINGVTWQDKDVEPNRTFIVPGLGTVVLNEQKITRLPGNRYAAKVTAIHIALSTSLPGLPIGTDIYVGTADAIVFD